MCRIQVITVCPNAARLDFASHAVSVGGIARPDACAQTVDGVIANRDGIFEILELGHGKYGTKDFFLEDAHLIVTNKDGRFDVVPVFQIVSEMSLLAADSAACALALANLDVFQNLLQLIARCLSAHHGGRIERIANFDLAYASDRAFQEFVEDGFLNQSARRASADFALVECEESKAFERLIEVIIVSIHHVREKDVGRLAAQLQGLRDDWLRRVLHDQTAGGGFTGESDFGDARVAGKGFADLAAGAGNYVEHAGWQQVSDESHQHQQAERSVGRRFDDHAISGDNGGRQFPGSHQQRKIPGDDLADDAQRFLEMICNGVVVNLAQCSFFGADAAGEVAEVIDGKRNISGASFANRFAVVQSFGEGEKLQIFFHLVGDLQQHGGANRGCGAAPKILNRMGCVECFLDIFRRRLCNFAYRRAVNRAVIGKIPAVHRCQPSATDEVFISGFDAALTKRGNRLLDGCLFDGIDNCHDEISFFSKG